MTTSLQTILSGSAKEIIRDIATGTIEDCNDRDYTPIDDNFRDTKTKIARWINVFMAFIIIPLIAAIGAFTLPLPLISQGICAFSAIVVSFGSYKLMDKLSQKTKELNIVYQKAQSPGFFKALVSKFYAWSEDKNSLEYRMLNIDNYA